MNGERVNERLTNNSQNEWMDGKLNEQLTNNSPNGWLDGELNDGSKITC